MKIFSGSIYTSHVNNTAIFFLSYLYFFNWAGMNRSFLNKTGEHKKMKWMGSLPVEARRVKYISLLERKRFIYLRFYKCPLSESHTALSGRAFYLKMMRVFHLEKEYPLPHWPKRAFLSGSQGVSVTDTGEGDGAGSENQEGKMTPDFSEYKEI